MEELDELFGTGFSISGTAVIFSLLVSWTTRS
jgi:hypothetical protein